MKLKRLMLTLVVAIGLGATAAHASNWWFVCDWCVDHYNWCLGSGYFETEQCEAMLGECLGLNDCGFPPNGP